MPESPPVHVDNLRRLERHEYLADRLVGVAAAPAQRPRQIVPRTQRQDADRGRRTNVRRRRVQHGQDPADGAVAAAGQESNPRHPLVQLDGGLGAAAVAAQIEHLSGVEQPLELLHEFGALQGGGIQQFYEILRFLLTAIYRSVLYPTFSLTYYGGYHMRAV